MNIKIITYNILADYLNNPEYVLVNKKYLDNEFRIKLLKKKIKEQIKKNTIICLQEVGPLQLSNLYIFFEEYKYKILYYNHLAICYPNKFILDYIELNKINTLSKKYINDKKILEKMEHFRHSYILTRLKYKDKNFTICTTHIIANPDYSDIKLYQSYILSKRLENENNVIFCGDFNSKPSSKIYELLSTGHTIINKKKLKTKNKFNSLYNKLNNNENNITTHTSNKITPKFTA